MPRPFLTRTAIRWALKHKPPARISILEDDPADQYHFSIELRDRDGKRRFIVHDIDHGGVGGIWFEAAGSKGQPRILLNSELRELRAEFLHSYQGYSVRYGSPAQFFWALLSFYPWRRAAWDRIAQRRFNRRPLARAGRIAVLRFFIENTLKKPDFRVSEINLLALMFSERYILHPDHEEAELYYTMVMDSLVLTNDLNRDGVYYSLNANAFGTVHHHEEEEQRHGDMVRQQRLLGRLTAALVFVGLLQVTVELFGTTIADSFALLLAWFA